jgi:phosphate/sulfate permease
MKRKQTTFEKSLKQATIISAIFGTCAVLVFSLYYTMDTVIERAFVLILGVIFLFPLIPIAISFIVNFIVNSEKQPDDKFKDNNYSKSNTTATKTNIEQEKYKPKVVVTEGYQEFNNLLKASMQNKLMTRECILKLKSELIYRLGTHIEVYKDFNFKNDLHCIYTLSKSSALTKEDYKYLSEFISNNLIFQKEA